MQKNKYYNLTINDDNKTADINIFGDITSFPWIESDVSNYNLSKKLEELKDIENINVFINSYGGEVAEGWAIYNSLKNHKAKVKTIVNGFACSIASVIFMAGDERIMNETSCLMIHNVLCYAEGNFNELRKQADILEKMNNLSKKTYLEHINISSEELQKMMDEETFLSPDECVKMGFATKIYSSESTKAHQSAKKIILEKLFNSVQKNGNDLNKIINEEEKYNKLEEIYESDMGNVEMNDNSSNQKAYHFFNAISK